MVSSVNIYAWDTKTSSIEQTRKIVEEVEELLYELDYYHKLISTKDVLDSDELGLIKARIAHEGTDVIQAVANLFSMMGINMEHAMDLCTKRQVDRGRLVL